MYCTLWLIKQNVLSFKNTYQGFVGGELASHLISPSRMQGEEGQVIVGCQFLLLRCKAVSAVILGSTTLGSCGWLKTRRAY